MLTHQQAPEILLEYLTLRHIPTLWNYQHLFWSLSYAFGGGLRDREDAIDNVRQLVPELVR